MGLVQSRIFQELTSAKDKAAAQSALHDALTSALAARGVRAISYRGGGGNHPVWSNGSGQIYYSYAPPRHDQPVQRHWNSFGLFAETGQLRIVVETNIAARAGESGTEAFFARDPRTGETLLMHSGLMGGGVPGLTQAAFHAWNGQEPFLVHRERAARIGVIVAQVGGRDMVAQIAEFVRRVASFKHDLDQGLLDQPQFKRKAAEAKGLLKEFVGTKSGRRSAEFTYETYHGAVVEALAAERRRSLRAGEIIDKNVLIDLFVKTNTALLEVYEVKSKIDRQSLYGAIGQLITHSAAAAGSVARILVVPEGAIVPDIVKALRRQRIAVRRYRLVSEGETKRVDLLGRPRGGGR